MGLGAWLLWQLRDRVRAGVLFAIYLLYAGAERFLVEFLRRNDESSLGLTTAQLESLAMMAAGAIWIAVIRRHGRHRAAGGERGSRRHDLIVSTLLAPMGATMVETGGRQRLCKRRFDAILRNNLWSGFIREDGELYGGNRRTKTRGAFGPHRGGDPRRRR